ncbi:hypothetical protein ACLE20_04010 [Rhizobium sp. YIM 134829]|uniref:hypothetical protein n=1 Tax=Rhizobium sp. YIM 134829 TaxID=3390453 RepID=UPI00397CFF3A
MPRSYPETAEPRSDAAGQPRFCIAPARRGFAVIDRLGRVGGIFISEAAARHFVFEETGGQSAAIFVDCSSVVDPFRMSAA